MERLFYICIIFQVGIAWNEDGKCDIDRGHVEASVNGVCPSNTKWDANLGCCVPGEPNVKEDYPHNGMQGDSANQCDVEKRQWEPLWDNSCPAGTGLDVKTGCCIPCKKCGPGYAHGTSCLHQCVPCPPQHYSYLKDNVRCLPCLPCETYHRHYRVKCSPTSPSECGGCMEGFSEYPHTGQEGGDIAFTTPCFVPLPHMDVTEKNYDRELSNLEEKNRERHNELQRMIIGLFAAIGIVVLVMIIFKLCTYMRRKQPDNKQATTEEKTPIVQSNEKQTVSLNDNKEKGIEAKDPEEKVETKPEGRINGKSQVEEKHDQK